MNAKLQRLLDQHDGVLLWSAACRAVTADVVEWASRRGQVVRPYPGVLADPARDDVGLPAALACAGPGAALSHTSALQAWRLPVIGGGLTLPGRSGGGCGGPVHVTTGLNRRIRVPGIVAHRRAGFVVEPPAVVIRDGLPVTALDAALVDAWPLMIGDAQRAPLLAAVNERMTTSDRLSAELRSRPNLAGRGELMRLVELLAAGCRSALELWGYEHVFTGPGFEGLQWQVPISLGSRTIWLDALDRESGTNLELDGAAFHGARKDRERDLRRDALLATRDIQVVRFSHGRLHHEAEQVRREALDIMAIRRAYRRRAAS